eukprot:gnl/MRDRNA2_/MRDRNA2_89123_c0_seq1.p1 gnl/MRDRNA2_/MRDRNA2_89123_c0~~gnl/MRDRNA2_/MRDRNA2_89123_c0_seq1.p1  ORF type:complete len:277 (+),score=44.70 gnl/MRDRNA2_/MRDRNA2_89123_c0_seq1:59-832(+)
MPATFADVEAYVQSIAISTCWAFLRTQHGGRPKTVDALRRVLQRHSIPRKNFVLHPVSLAHAVGDMLPQKDAILRKLEARLRAPALDPLNLFSDPFVVPQVCIERVRRDLSPLVSKGTIKKPEQFLDWLVSQAYCSRLVEVDTVVMGLIELGALIVDDNGVVWYIDAMADWNGDVAVFLPYLQPWLLECPPSPSDIPIAHIKPCRSLRPSQSTFRVSRRQKENRIKRHTQRRSRSETCGLQHRRVYSLRRIHRSGRK